MVFAYVPSGRFELPTPALGERCSIPLSYEGGTDGHICGRVQTVPHYSSDPSVCGVEGSVSATRARTSDGKDTEGLFGPSTR